MHRFDDMSGMLDFTTSSHESVTNASYVSALDAESSGMKVLSRMFCAILVPAICVPDAVFAYSYPDSRVTRFCTDNHFSCLLDDTGKGLLIDVSGKFPNPSKTESKILELNPLLVPSAPFMVRQLSLYLQADDSGNWIISIHKALGRLDEPGFIVAYKLTDIALSAQSSPSQYMRLRFYVMKISCG